MGTPVPPTIVWPVPATKVTAPDAEPRFIIDQSNEILAADTPPMILESVNVPVGNVNDTAVADVTVIIDVCKLAIVNVPVAVCAFGVADAWYSIPLASIKDC